MSNLAPFKVKAIPIANTDDGRRCSIRRGHRDAALPRRKTEPNVDTGIASVNDCGAVLETIPVKANNSSFDFLDTALSGLIYSKLAVAFGRYCGKCEY